MDKVSFSKHKKRTNGFRGKFSGRIGYVLAVAGFEKIDAKVEYSCKCSRLGYDVGRLL